MSMQMVIRNSGSMMANYLDKQSSAAPLAVFRMLFGIMMLISLIRFWSYGWIDKLYIQPGFFFSYYGFEWVKPLGQFTYVLFFLCGASAFFVMIGYQYRYAIITFFLSFTYIELMDKTTYLNHYYFISSISFLMIFLPANAYFSFDAFRSEKIASRYVPQWNIDSIKLLLGVVYFYAGLAKLNSDWLLEAMPLKIWLPSKFDLPFMGQILNQEWLHYAFSWGGAFYDLSVPFLLLYARTRMLGFTAVLVFHLLTRALFPIGMFPYIMIASTLIFFSVGFHEGVIIWLKKLFRINMDIAYSAKMKKSPNTFLKLFRLSIIYSFFAAQLIIPFRHLLYPGELFWTEEGFRFSWRVMLMEKAGYANFKIVDKITGKRFYVNNSDFLSSFQEKQMATQPDFILEYAHYLADHFQKQGHENVQVFVESYVALNGRSSQLYIDPTIDLVEQKESFQHKTWILPFNDDIKGI